MRSPSRVWPSAALLIACALAARGQTPAAIPAGTPTPTPAAPPAGEGAATPAAAATPINLATPTPVIALRITDAPTVWIARLPTDNPFGSAPTAPAALPPKLAFTDGSVTTGMFVSIHVDPAGRALAVRRDRDPIPSLAAETLKSLQRWTFAPARRAGQPVDAWGAFRLDLAVEIRAPRVLQMGFVPVSPATPIPMPFAWPGDAEWLETRHASNPPDGSVPIDQVDTAPIPQKTPWSADSYKGAFQVKFWVKVDKAGHVERAIPLDCSDPVLLGYFRKAMNAWAVRPAQAGGAPTESWNELTLGGQISYSDEIRQIIALRKNLGN